jgi:hypothetical protein
MKTYYVHDGSSDLGLAVIDDNGHGTLVVNRRAVGSRFLELNLCTDEDEQSPRQPRGRRRSKD